MLYLHLYSGFVWESDHDMYDSHLYQMQQFINSRLNSIKYMANSGGISALTSITVDGRFAEGVLKG